MKLTASSRRSLTKSLTAFLLCHSLTLTLSTLGNIFLPPTLTEWIVGLSVVYIGMETLLHPERDTKAWLAGVLGLLHGFGFSGILREVVPPPDGAALCLSAFDAGQAASQVAVCAALFSLVLRWRKDIEHRLAATTKLAPVPVVAFGRAAACLSNLRQISLSYTMYQSDYDDRLPLTNHSGGLASWIEACQPYIKNHGIYRCPSDTSATPWAETADDWTNLTVQKRRSSYFLNAWLAGGSASGASLFGKDGAVKSPSSVIYVAESVKDSASDHFHPMCWGAPDPDQTPACTAASFAWDSAKNETREIDLHRHQEGANYAFVDGHVKWGKWSQMYFQKPGVYEGYFDPRNE